VNYTNAFGDKHIQISAEGIKTPKNVDERTLYWKYYVGEILSSTKSAVLDHVAPPDRRHYPSAHNYYLDFTFNFGLLALLPLLGLLTVTLVLAYRNWGAIAASPPHLGLASVVVFFDIVDNSLKVGMRQPYPGILTFFLWGLLRTQLTGKLRRIGSLSPL